MAQVYDEIREPVKSMKGEQADLLARQTWGRYEYVKQRGHLQWCDRAIRYEQYYLGGGLHWIATDREALESEGRLPVECNEVADAVNTALGYQINNRADISFKPRGQGASDDLATTLSKVTMQVADNNKLRWHESQVFADGLIQTAGYFEIIVDFGDSMRGEVRVGTLDPLDVIPDPDAKSYDPDDWSDVIITRWPTFDEVEAHYGTAARKRVEASYLAWKAIGGERDFGTDTDDAPRSSFGDPETLNTYQDAFYEDGGIPRVRVVDRQRWMLVMTRVVVYPTGDIRVAENATPEKLTAWRTAGCTIMRRPTRRVRWTVSTCETLLMDVWSPLAHFSVVPYFPYFRRGQRKGLVDDAVGPQDMLNKALTAYTHIVAGSANSGWIIEQNSLTNMKTEDLDEMGAANGLVLEYVKGSKAPEKIKPNEVPGGVADLAALGSRKIKTTSGNTDEIKGQAGKTQSGIAIQSMQYAAQMALSVPLDNLARTRHMVAMRILEIIQAFYDDMRVFRITQTDPVTGEESTTDMPVNQPNPQQPGSIINDVTIGEYDVVITEQPSQVTFDNSQFNQAMEMRKEGVKIPDSVLVRNSTLSNKAEIIKQMQAANDPAADSLAQLNLAKAALANAQAALAQANAISKNVEALFSAIRTGQIVLTMPGVATVADGIAKSAGFVDKDEAPIYPEGSPEAAAAAGAGAPGGVTPPPISTNPLTPDNPDVGAESGIENGAPQPVTTGA